jgi:hypothetical protein
VALTYDLELSDGSPLATLPPYALLSVALDGRLRASRPIADRPRPMMMGLAQLKGLRPTRLVTTFEQYCHDAITDRTLPGLDDAN